MIDVTPPPAEEVVSEVTGEEDGEPEPKKGTKKKTPPEKKKTVPASELADIKARRKKGELSSRAEVIQACAEYGTMTRAEIVETIHKIFEVPKDRIRTQMSMKFKAMLKKGVEVVVDETTGVVKIVE